MKLSALDDSAFSHVINELPNYVFFKDLNLVYRFCNYNFAQFAGLNSQDEIVGKSDYDLPWSNKFAEQYRNEDREVIETGKALTFPHVSIKINDEEKILHISKSPLYDQNNQIIGILCIYIDITERTNLEKNLKAALNVKNEFIANMSHDLRTPMTGISGMLHGLRNVAVSAESCLKTQPSLEKLSGYLKEFIARIYECTGIAEESTQELLDLFNQILEAIKLESGKIEKPPVVAFDLSAMIKRSVRLLQAVARHKDLDLSFEIDSSIPQYFFGIQPYLERSLSNLLSNALKFTKEGFVKVVVETRSSNNKPGDVMDIVIKVQDSGIGIPTEKFSEIFEHFSRVNPSYEGVYKGSGLGLYSVKQYITAMEGEVDVASTLSEGTCFTVKLPLKVASETDLPKEQESLDQQTPLASKLGVNKQPHITSSSTTVENPSASILVVEDSLPAMTSIRLALEPYGCAVDTAMDGETGLEKASSNSYTLIISDVGLPGISGVEMTRRIRALDDKEKAEVPIVALTGHAGDAEKRQECLDAGMQHVMSKPVQPMLLESVLKRFAFSTEETQQACATEDNGKKIIDWPASVQKLSGNVPGALEILRLVFEDLHDTKQTLAKAYEKKNTVAMRAELHRCRGGVCCLELPELDAALREFHEAIKDVPQDADKIQTLYDELQTAIDNFWKEARRINLVKC